MRYPLALAVLVVSSLPVLAQGAGADGRYVLRDSPQGLLRMETRTGAMSLCATQNGTFTCRLVPDDRAALEAEVERLKAENDTLRRAGATAAAPRTTPDDGTKLNLPSDQEVDRVMGLVERIWRRFVDVMRQSEQPPSSGRL
ncbi:MAG: hypothetical protein WCH83_13990 [Alphaproteobacteria bacterium]